MSKAKASSNMVFHMSIDDVNFTPTIQEMKRQVTILRKEYDLQIKAAKELGNEEKALSLSIEKHEQVAKREVQMQKQIQEVLERNKVVTKENEQLVSKATKELRTAEGVEQTETAQRKKSIKQLTRYNTGIDQTIKSLKEMSDKDKLVTEKLKAEGKETEAQEQHLKSLDKQRKTTNSLIEEQAKLLSTIDKNAPNFSEEKMNLEAYKTALAKLDAQEKKLVEQNSKLNKNLATNKETIARISSVTNAYVSKLQAEGKQYAANSAKLKGLVQEYAVNKKILSEQVAELGRLKTKYGETSKEYKDQAAAVSELNSKMGEQTAHYKKLAKASGGRNAGMIAESDNYAKLGKKIGNVGDKFLQVGHSSSMFSLGVAAAFVKSNKNASELQQTFLKTKNIIQTSGESAKESIDGVNQMQKEGKKYSLEYGESQNNIAKGYEDLVKRGYNSKQALGAMRHEVEASKASGDDFSDVLKVTSQTMESFGLSMDKTGRPLKSVKEMTKNTKETVNELAFAADATSMGFSDMGVAMSYVGTTAKTAGFSLSETSSALGILSNNGLEADKAGTGLRKVINSLIAPTGAGAEALAELGISTKSFVDQNGNMKSMTDIMGILNDHTKELGGQEKGTLFKTLFGVTGMQAGQILATNADNLGELNKKVAEAAKNNYVHNLAQKNMASFKGQFDKMKAALDQVGMSLQKNVLPLLTGMMKWATNLLKKFSEMSPSVQKIITVIAVLAAAFAPVTLAVGGILKSLQIIHSVVGKVNSAFGKSKLGGLERQVALLQTEKKELQEILALQVKVDSGFNTKGGKPGKGISSASTMAAQVETMSRVERNAGKNVGIIQKLLGGAKKMGVGGFINVGIAGSEIATSIWGAFNAKSKSAQSQKTWELAGTSVGTAIGGIVGGPEGAMWGASIGKAITKNITWKKVKTKFEKSPKPKNPSTKTTGGFGLGYVPVGDSGEKIAKKAKKNAKAFTSEWSRAFKSIRGGSASSLKSFDTFASKINKQLNSSKNKELKSLKDLYKQGYISKEQYEKKVSQVNKKYSGKNSLGAQAKKDTKEVVKARKDLNNKIKSINKTYAKLEKGQSKSEVRRLERERKNEILKANKEGNKKIKKAEDKLANDLSKISTNSSKKQKKIANQLKNSVGKISNAQAAKLINESYKTEQAQIKSANKTYDKTVSAAAKKRDKTIAEAKAEFSGNDAESKKMRNSIIEKANETYKNTEEKARAKKKAATDNAKEEHNNVVEEARKSTKDLSAKYDEETGNLKTIWDRMKGWFADNPVILSIKKGASDLWNMVTGHKKGHALGGEISEDHTALVGEEGPEYAYNKRTRKARLLGEHGPEVTRVYAGEQILTAGQTSGMANLPHKTIASYASGTQKKKDNYMFTTAVAQKAKAGKYLYETKALDKLKPGKNMFTKKNMNQKQTLFLNVDKKSQRKFEKSLKSSSKSVKKFQKDNDNSMKKNLKETSKLMDKTTKKVKDSYDQLSDDTKNQMKDFRKQNSKDWDDVYKKTKDTNKNIYDYTTKKNNDLKNSLASNTKNIYNTWKKDWGNVSSSFNKEFGKLSGFSKNGMNGAITSLNTGIGNINGLIGRFGGNNSILPKINHYATGTNGKIQQDEMALVNDALGSNYKEIVVLPSGKMIMPDKRNAVMPLMKGSAVINGNQVANLKSSGRLQAHADGTMSDDAMEKLVSSKIKDASGAWQQDFTNKVPVSGTALQQSLTSTAKTDIKQDAVPWYLALWTVIQDQMALGSGTRGAFLKYAEEHYTGHPYLMGGNGPLYYDCSGMVAAALRNFGIDIGRTTTAMQGTTDHISKGEAKPGDLTIWGDADGAAGHVGIVKNPRTGTMFNETPPKAGIGNYLTPNGLSWKGIFRIRQLHDEDPNQPKPNPKLKALVKSQLGSKALGWIGDKFSPTPNTGGQVGGEYDPDLIRKAAKAMKVNPTDAYIKLLQGVIQTESGGNAKIIQQVIDGNTGANKAAGILQYTPGTFNTFAMPGHKNRMNAYDQLLAFFNNTDWKNAIGYPGYAHGKPDWLHSGPIGRRRYEVGGFIDHHQIAEVGEHNKAEMVIPLTNKNRAYQLMDQAVRYMGDGDSYGSAKSNNTDSFELVDEIRNLRDDTNTLLKLLIKVVEEKPTGYNQYQIQKDIAQINSYKQMNTAIMRGK